MNYCWENKSHRHTSEQPKVNHRPTHIFTSQLHVMMTRFFHESINRAVFTRMSKRNPIVSTEHDSRVSCSVYAFNRVDLYHGLQHVCYRYINTVSRTAIRLIVAVFPVLSQNNMPRQINAHRILIRIILFNLSIHHLQFDHFLVSLYYKYNKYIILFVLIN